MMNFLTFFYSFTHVNEVHINFIEFIFTRLMCLCSHRIYARLISIICCGVSDDKKKLNCHLQTCECEWENLIHVVRSHF